MTSQPRVLVFGTGSVGTVYAWLLSRAVSPANVYCVCRSNYNVASSQGFTINSSIFGENISFKPVVARTVAEAVALSGGTPFDYIVVTAKAIPSTPSIPEQLQAAVTPGKTTIALIQNGIAIEELYHAMYPDNPLLSCVVYLPATQTSPAVVSHREIELLHIGPYPSLSSSSSSTATTSADPTSMAAATAFSTLLNSGGSTTKVHEDVQSARFSKLLVNGSWNPICALSLSRDAQFLASSPPTLSLALVESVMLELSALASACGYPEIDGAAVAHQISRAKVRAPPGVEPSMLADAKAHARMEVDAIVGNAVRLAEQKGVKTPLLRAVYALVKALDLSFAREREASVKSDGNVK